MENHKYNEYFVCQTLIHDLGRCWMPSDYECVRCPVYCLCHALARFSNVSGEAMDSALLQGAKKYIAPVWAKDVHL